MDEEDIYAIHHPEEKSEPLKQQTSADDSAAGLKSTDEVAALQTSEPSNAQDNQRSDSQSNLVDNEMSIYEQSHLTEQLSTTDSNSLSASNFTFSPADKKVSEMSTGVFFGVFLLQFSVLFLLLLHKLSFIGNDAEFIPTELIYQFGLKTLVLDLSFNCISDLRDLAQFPNLEELICDNNYINDNTHYPQLANLKLFSCNKNQIEDIHIFIDKIKAQFPNLTYLSMLGNKACPNQLIDMTKDDYDYSRYRKYVLYRMKSLRFLDCYEVTQQEKEDMQSKDELFYDVVTFKEGDPSSPMSASSYDEPNREIGNYTPLEKSTTGHEDGEEANPQASFGYCRFVYYGKQSEGNRFIKNDDL